jgi:hypothetical protein
MKFKPIYKKITEEMQEQGLVTVLSNKFTHNFEYHLAKGLAPIKEEFYRKHKASRYYTNQLESISVEI